MNDDSSTYSTVVPVGERVTAFTGDEIEAHKRSVRDEGKPLGAEFPRRGTRCTNRPKPKRR